MYLPQAWLTNHWCRDPLEIDFNVIHFINDSQLLSNHGKIIPFRTGYWTSFFTDESHTMRPIRVIWYHNMPSSKDGSGKFLKLPTHPFIPHWSPTCLWSLLKPRLNIKTFSGKGISLIKIRGHDTVRSIMGIPYLVKRHLYIEMSPELPL